MQITRSVSYENATKCVNVHVEERRKNENRQRKNSEAADGGIFRGGSSFCVGIFGLLREQ